jgi:NADH-quinone oxidoreductase subunit M
MYKRVIYGKVANQGVAGLTDINRRELLILATLAFVVLLFGVWPNPLLEVMHPSIEHLVQHVLQSKL